MIYFNLDGSEFIEDGHALAPIGLLMKDTIDCYKGWYFFDEGQGEHGPFNSFEEAVESFKKHGEQL